MRLAKKCPEVGRRRRISVCNQKKRLALALCGHFLYVEGNGEEGKVHSDLVFAEVPEPFVLHVCLHLPEIRFRLCASFPPVAL